MLQIQVAPRASDCSECGGAIQCCRVHECNPSAQAKSLIAALTAPRVARARLRLNRSSVNESNSRSAYRWTSHQINMLPSVKSDAAKKTPTASRSLARRTMRTASKATAAQTTAIRLNLRRTDSEKNEYRPENHWNARYQSQPSPPITKNASILRVLDGTMCLYSAGCTLTCTPNVLLVLRFLYFLPE